MENQTKKNLTRLIGRLEGFIVTITIFIIVFLIDSLYKLSNNLLVELIASTLFMCLILIMFILLPSFFFDEN